MVKRKVKRETVEEWKRENKGKKWQACAKRQARGERRLGPLDPAPGCVGADAEQVKLVEKKRRSDSWDALIIALPSAFPRSSKKWSNFYQISTKQAISLSTSWYLFIRRFILHRKKRKKRDRNWNTSCRCMKSGGLRGFSEFQRVCGTTPVPATESVTVKRPEIYWAGVGMETAGQSFEES